MIRQVLFTVVLTALHVTSCKPKAAESSDVNAIVGVENGKNKAMAIIAVRNNTNINSKMPDNAGGKIVLNKVFETYYALVECSDDSKAKADTWMNLLEFYGLSSVLYLDGDRNLHMNRTGTGTKVQKIYFPACEIVGKNLLTLPMLLSSGAMADDFPDVEPTDEKLKDQYLLLQSIYLAIRGPYSSTGTFAISPSLVGMSATSKAYPALAFSETQMGKTFAGSDYFYNPCVTEKIKTDKGYMQDWKMNYFTCEKSTASKGLSNYKPGGLTGYSAVKEKLKYGMLTLYAATQGGITESSPKADKLTAALMTTESWKNIDGPAKKFAEFLSGNLSYNNTFSDSLGLTGDDDESDFSYAGSDGDEPVSFGLADAKPKSGPTAEQKAKAQQQAVDEGKKILDLIKHPENSPNFSRFTFADNAALLSRYGIGSKKESDVILKDNREAIKNLDATRSAALLAKTWSDAKELAYKNERAKIYNAALADLSSRALVKQTATFAKKDYKNEFNVESIMSQNKEVYLTQTAQGKLTEYNQLSAKESEATKKANQGIPAASTLWIDRTLEAKTGAEKVSWQKDGVGGQVVKTEGLTIQSDFHGNKRPDGTLSNIGVFTLNDAQLKNATTQVESLAKLDTTALDAANKAAGGVGVQGQPANYWNQLSAGFGQMGAGLNVAAEAGHKAQTLAPSLNTQVNQLSQNTGNANNEAFFKTANAAQTNLQATAGNGLSTAWNGTQNAASATGSLVSDAYQNNSMFKTVSDFSGATTMASTASSAWSGVSTMWNGTGAGKSEAISPPVAPAPIPAGVTNPGGQLNNGSTTSPYASDPAPAPALPTEI